MGRRKPFPGLVIYLRRVPRTIHPRTGRPYTVHDVHAYRDPACTVPFRVSDAADMPPLVWHAGGYAKAPDLRNTSVMINCVRRPIVWVDTAPLEPPRKA